MKALNKDAQNLRTIYSEEDVDVLENEILYGCQGSNGSGSGASQTLGGGDPNEWKRIPQYKNECALWALTNIALDKRKTLSFPDGNGGTVTRHINSENYWPVQAYSDIKGLAQNRVWHACDVNGNELTGEGAKTYTYTDGEMNSSVVRTIGQEAGILSGGQKYFKKYEDLHTYMTENKEWLNANHKNGTYLISNKHNGVEHTSVCNGFDNKGRLKYKDSTGSHTYNSTDNCDDEWTLIY